MTIIRTNIKLKAGITDPKHLVNKEWVEQKIEALIKDAVDCATIAALPACTYAGDPNFTLTGNANGALTAIDNTPPATDDRILVKDQADKTQNGIYVVTAVGDVDNAFVLTRADDMNATQDLKHNLIVPVMEGVSQKDSRFQLTTNGVLTLDTSLLVFQKYYSSVGVNSDKGTFAGDNTNTQFNIAHNLGTEDVIVTIRDANKEELLLDIRPTNINTISITFDVAPADTELFRYTIQGQVD